VVQFQALYEVPCECEDVCGCDENEMGERVRWEAEDVKAPSYGVHVDECEGKGCAGCWVYQLDGPMPLWGWMVENLGAQGGAVVVDGRVVDGWSVFQ
jgi:hypothetical protein